MATFKAQNVAAQLASNLALRLQKQGNAGANITVTLSTTSIGTAAYIAPVVLIGTQAAGAHSNSCSLIFLPEQLNLTSGICSNVWNNSIGIAQEVYTPHQLLVGFETPATGPVFPFDNQASILAILGECVSTGMRVTEVFTASGTAPTPANTIAGTQLSPSFVIDQYNPLTQQS